jgi:hypothetical protein
VSIEPASQQVAVGVTTTTDIVVEDVSNLQGFELQITFDPAVVEVLQVEPGGFLSPDWVLPGTIDNDNGIVDYALCQTYSEPVTGTGALATVTWRGQGAGISPITFTYVTLSAPRGVPITASTQGGQIAVGEGQTPPSITSLSPVSVLAGSSPFNLTVDGTNFVTESVVHWDGAARPTTFISNTQLTAEIAADDVSSGGTVDVRVVNPLAQGGTSAAETFTVTNPAPVVTSMNPITATAGGPAFTLTVNGEQFVDDSTILWDGSARPTSFVSTTQLTTTIAAGHIAQPGVVPISVENPAPGGGTSGELPFEVVEAGAAPYTDFIYLPMVISNGS